MPAPIQQGQVIQGLLRRLGIVGRFPMLLDGTVVPTFEIGRLERGDLGIGPVEAAGAVTLAGAAATQVVTQLFANDIETTVLRLRRIVVNDVTAGARIIVRDSATILGAVDTPVFFTDLRFAGREPAGTLRTLRVAGGLVGNDLAQSVAPGNVPIEFTFKNLIIPTGRGVHVVTTAVNSTMLASFEWDELDGGTV